MDRFFDFLMFRRIHRRFAWDRQRRKEAEARARLVADLNNLVATLRKQVAESEKSRDS